MKMIFSLLLFFLFSGRKCHRYQFECRSTGDCIAIYNACDGIPQCADGSDEAPELGCPGSVTTVLPAPVHPNPPTNVIYNQNVSRCVIHNNWKNISPKLNKLTAGLISVNASTSFWYKCNIKERTSIILS